MIAPKPTPPKRTSFLSMWRGFRTDILSAMPGRLYHAWMAEFRAGPIHSFVCNDPALVSAVLRERPAEFPKSSKLVTGLLPLLGRSVFITNGDEWARQRRIIDPAFEGGKLRATVPAMVAAAKAGVARLPGGGAFAEIDIEPITAHIAADIIFRTLFSIPIEDETAARVFAAFAEHQDAQPLVNPAALIPWPRWWPSPHSRRTRKTAAEIRALIATMVARRAEAIKAGSAPDDLATKIMTTPDPETGALFTREEMVDQVAIFFLAGHETSASALAWSLWLLSQSPEWQDRVAAEGAALPPDPSLADLSKLVSTRAVFREAMRLYPPVPIYIREAACPQTFRNRHVPVGAQIVISPWHLHRHDRLWPEPDAFCPERFSDPSQKQTIREAYIPFSAGARACPGAGFAMAEGPLILAMICAAREVSGGAATPMPVARLTVRGRDGIRVTLSPRETPSRPGA